MRDMKKVFVDSQREGLMSGVIDRRRFLSGMVAAGVSLPVAVSIADEVFAMTPKRGGTLRLGISQGSTTDSLDPATYENAYSLGTGYMYANSLTEINNKGELVPELAESYDSSDAKTWTFKLRRGIEFHNGKTLTSDDVIASFNHHRGEDSKSAAKDVIGNVVDIRKDGDNVVIFELDTPSADFPFAISDYHLLIMPDVGGGKIDPLSGIGTGSYILDKYEAGVRTTGRRNPNYWKPDSAWFDEINMIVLSDTVARQSALQNGEVDIIDRLDPKTVGLLARNPNVNILETTGTFQYTFPMRLNVSPFDNYDLRMALKLAVKRQELVDKILFGHGIMGNDSPLSPVANRYAAKNIPQRDFDADKAAFHYKKSGHSGRIQLSASDAAFTGAVDAAQLVAASASEVGIDVEVVREPADGYWANVWNKKGWCACYWGGRPTADWMFTAAYTDDTEWNDTAWKGTNASKKFNALVREARSELNETKRQALYEEAQVLLHDDGGALIPMFANYINGLSTKIAHGDNVAANWDLDGGKATERWWFA